MHPASSRAHKRVCHSFPLLSPQAVLEFVFPSNEIKTTVTYGRAIWKEMENEDYGGRSCAYFSEMIIIRAYSQPFLSGFLIKIQVYLDF